MLQNISNCKQILKIRSFYFVNRKRNRELWIIHVLSNYVCTFVLIGRKWRIWYYLYSGQFFTISSKPLNINVHPRHLCQGLFMPIMRIKGVYTTPVGETICKILMAEKKIGSSDSASVWIHRKRLYSTGEVKTSIFQCIYGI